jgi:hypothetical protein
MTTPFCYDTTTTVESKGVMITVKVMAFIDGSLVITTNDGMDEQDLVLNAADLVQLVNHGRVY